MVFANGKRLRLAGTGEVGLLALVIRRLFAGGMLGDGDDASGTPYGVDEQRLERRVA